ncbi:MULTISPECIES: ATP-binding protein [Cupriavidus]|uniref:ATP-binding protein n=1 Tax=Cupriavidus TaxID=106589 RepID=UPI000466F9BB|nr:MULTISPECIES: ATP-binding protein [Cupriavidus]
MSATQDEDIDVGTEFPRIMKRALLLILAVLAGFVPYARAMALDTWGAAEEAWLKEHHVLRIAVDPYWQPLEYVEKGAAHGLSIAYIHAIADRLGLTVQLVPTKSWSEAVRKLLDGEVDVLPAVPDFQLPKSAGTRIALTRPYYVGTTLVVAKARDKNYFDLSSLGCITVAVKEGGAYHQWFEGHPLPCTRILPEPSDSMALAAVRDGKAAAAVGPSAVLHPLIRLQYDKTLHIAGTIAELPLVLRMAVRQDSAPLLSLMNQALASLSAGETDQLYQNWLEGADYLQPSLKALWHYYGATIVLFLIVLISLGVSVYQAMRARANALKSEKVKSEFLAIMSHEIRTPISAVVGALELLDREDNNTPRRELLHRARESADSLLAVLNNVLDYSSISTGKILVKPSALRVNDLVRSVLDGFEAIADRKGIALQLNDQSGGHTINLDGNRIRQVLGNLVANAIKFTEQGTVTVDVRLSRSERSSERVTLAIRVSDTGIGIAPEDQPRLFQPFSQVGNARQRQTGSSGLGLSICKKLVEAMGGSISIWSTLGQGTTVEFSLETTIADTHDETDLPPSPQVAASVSGAILVVEDTPANQLVLMEQLRALGYDPVLAESGAQAIDLFSTRSFAAILLDLHLPDVDGFTVAKQMRAREDSTHSQPTPIIAVTAEAGPEQALRSLDAGIDCVLAKPINLQGLQETLHLWIPDCNATGAIGATAPDALNARDASHSSLLERTKTMAEYALLELAALDAAARARDTVMARHHLHRLKGTLLQSSQLTNLAENIPSIEASLDKDVDWDGIVLSLQHLRSEILRQSADDV